jgi:hypothetical protein
VILILLFNKKLFPEQKEEGVISEPRAENGEQ